jgi:hypothetical protein
MRAFDDEVALTVTRLYLARMLQRTALAGFIAPCLPTKTDKLPSGSQWLHEIKHDGFRIIARKNGERVKLYSRPGNDFTRRFPLIVDALSRLRSRSCIMQAWPCGPSSGSRRRSSSASIDEAYRPCGPWAPNRLVAQYLLDHILVYRRDQNLPYKFSDA